MTEGDPARMHQTQSAADTAQPAGEGASQRSPEHPQRYQVIAEHGRGGLGRVSRALDRDLARDVAIKELLVRTPHAEARFLREAMITARLEHPGVVPVHEVGRWPDGTPYYAMKLVSGRPLRALLAERTTVRERLALLHHVIAVADAIAYAHGRGIIHRDLKPANVIVGEFGETIVIDWGLAKDLRAGDQEEPREHAPGSPDPELTQTGAVLGTPAYMPPEQERGEHVDQRADVFALGAMLWELCSLDKVPPADLALRHRMLARAGVDRDLVEILDKALAADAARRYPDAGALAADLKAFTSGSRIAARDYSLLAMLGHWTRRHRALTAGIAAFALVIIASVIALAVLYGDAEHNAAVARANADTAKQRLVQSYIEQGRRLSLDGDYLRALPYLSEAYTLGDRSTALRFLLARAERLAGGILATHPHRTANARANDREVVATFRADGTVLSISNVGEAAIWDADTGRVRAALPSQRTKPGYQRVSDDGHWTGFASEEGIALWDGVATYVLSTGPIDRIAFEHEGTRLAAVHGREISVWDTGTRQQLWSKTLPRSLSQVVWGSDVVVAIDTAQIAHVITQGNDIELQQDGGLYALAVGPRGTIATLGETLTLWTPRGQPIATIVSNGMATAVAFSPDEQDVAVGTNLGELRIYDRSGAYRRSFVGQAGAMRGISFSPDGQRLASASADGSTLIWRVADQVQLASILAPHSSTTLAAPRFDAQQARVGISTNKDARVLVASSLEQRAVFPMTTPVVAIKALDKERQLLIASNESVERWDLPTHQRRSVTPRSANTSGLPHKISDDGAILASLNAPFTVDDRRVFEGRIQLFDLVRQRVMSEVPGRFRSFALDPAGQQLATASDGSGIRLWGLDGRQLLHLDSPNVNSVVFNRNGSQLVAVTNDHLELWDVRSGQRLARAALSARSYSPGFDAANQHVMALAAQRLTIYDARTLQQRVSMNFESKLLTAEFDAAGREFLITGMNNGMVAISDLRTSSRLAQFRHSNAVLTASFSPSGDYALSGGGDQRAIVWHTDLESRPPEAVAAFARCHAPYKLVETRLEPAELVCDALAAAMRPAR